MTTQATGRNTDYEYCGLVMEDLSRLNRGFIPFLMERVATANRCALAREEEFGYIDHVSRAVAAELEYVAQQYERRLA